LLPLTHPSDSKWNTLSLLVVAAEEEVFTPMAAVAQAA
jgi:hypothetical protein